MRRSWLRQLITNWMGDDAFLRSEHTEFRRFNIEGDVQWIKGKVARKWIEGMQHLLEIEALSENQRGEVAVPAQYQVVLPSKTREHAVPM